MFSKLRIISVLFAVFAGMVVEAASVSPDEKPAIPPDLFFELKTLAVDENAIIDWRRAAEVAVALNEKEKQLMKFCWTPAAKKPSDDELNDLKSWLRRNEAALNLFNQSLKKNKAQWPERNPQNEQPEIKALSILIRARLLEADQLAEQKKLTEAVSSLEDTLKAAQKGIEGDPALIHYLISSSARTLTQDAILRFAARKEVPAALVVELLNHLPSLDSETNVFDRVVRVEFTRDYNNSIDLKKLTETWSKISETNIALSIFPEDSRHAFKVLLDPSLVALHPKPYDVNAEIEKSIRHYRIYRTNSFLPWEERMGEVEVDRAENHTNLMDDIKPLMELVKDEPLPLSKQAVQKVRQAYLQIDNPVGRIFDCSITGFISSDLRVFHCRTEREATRAFLALVIFEKRRGHLPSTLAELVGEKILNAIPLDFFSGEPFHYSSEKRIIWSVSDDGVDDNGESGKTRWYEKDAVWNIPRLN